MGEPPLEPFQVLLEADGDQPFVELPTELAQLYGGGLGFRGPRLYANFVSSLDGVVALEAPGTGSGAAISGRNRADRFLMGLLRALADAVLLGASTLRAESPHRWVPAAVYPPAAAGFAELRRRLGKPEEPQLVVLTGGDGADLAGLPGRPLVLGGGEQDLRLVMDRLRDEGYQVVLTEGGPNLVGGLLAAGLLDELFLTISPVLAGRLGGDRLGLVEGLKLLPGRERWTRLLSVRRHGSHLFLRYEL